MVIAIDLGASNIRIAEVRGTKLFDKKISKTPPVKLEIKKLLFNLIEQYPKNKICVSVAGEEIGGKIFGALNMDFNSVPLRKILMERFKVPVFVENDGNCAGLAELHFGNGRGKKNFVLLTIGTGIGGAIIIDGKLYKGRGSAGEPGSMFMGEHIFERLASGSAQSLLAKKYGFKNISHLELQSLAERGNRKAKLVFEELGKNLGVGIKNIIYLLDPEVIILGGGFSKVKLYWDSMKKVADSGCIAGRKTPIIGAKFKDDAGLIGAALLERL